jgi:hypothetical protein
MSDRAKWIGRLIFWPLFLWLMFLVIQNPAYLRYRVSDWWTLRSYDAPATVEQLATETGLTGTGRNIFYASEPALHDKHSFNQYCVFPEQSFVIGCYDGDRIHVLDIDVRDLEPAEPVTAAHEMLHAAWVRLKKNEREELEKLLLAQYRDSKDQHLIDLVRKYEAANNSDPDIIVNELHSILGTEIYDLSPQLESYYARYFTNRRAVVDLYQSYEAVFAATEAELAELRAEIDAIYADIEAKGSSLELQKRRIDATDARLRQLAASGDEAGYNSLHSQQSALINRYNSAVEIYNSRVALYQSLVERYKDLTIRQNDLVNALNSKVEIIQ